MPDTATFSDLARLWSESLEEVREKEGVAPEGEEIKNATFLIYRAMTSRSRCYHDLSHLFSVAHNLPALAKLAAIYHDVVYFSIDGGFPPDVRERIGDVVLCLDSKIFLTTSPDEMVSEVATIFGFTGGQEIKPKGGLNEFLSAVLAVRELGEFLSVNDLWAVAACIEATIPFRPTVDQETPIDLIGMRLRSLRRSTVFLTDEEIYDSQILAVRVANADVQNFGNPDLSHFIENTWHILTETNADFHEGNSTIGTYRAALVGMETFLSELDPTVIFRQYGNTPDDETYQALLECSRDNLHCASEYLKALIVALSVLEALAELTDGDGPIAYFIGLADSEKSLIDDFVNGAPLVTVANQPPLEAKVLRALKCKRTSVNRFDQALTPLAAYLYESLGNSKIHELVQRAKEVHAGKRDWKEFLAALPDPMLRHVTTAISRIAVVRKNRFNESRG